MNIQETAALMTILLPAVAAFATVLAGKESSRIKKIAYAAAAAMAISAVLMVLAGTDKFHIILPQETGLLAMVLEILLAGIFLYYAVKLKSIIIAAGSVIEIVFSALGHQSGESFSVDALSMILILITSLLGAVILIYSLRYMRDDSRKREFFAVVFVFLAAMNGAAVSSGGTWFILFWGVTTLCSFLLIRHTGTPEAERASTLALQINLSGGAALAVGMYLASSAGSSSLDAFNSSSMAVPALFLIAAAMAKSAQFPFQEWLPGAMAAPVPVSALLHSATMVNLGVYLLIRISQVFADTPALSQGVAFIGLVSFTAAAALAAVQTNAKRLLAYSTISNLGLIVMCAGIAQPHALTAAIILLIYHSVSKALLFLTVGAVKEKIGSENIEDMRTLDANSMFLAGALFTGIVSITLPPFGVFASKWIIISASSANPGIIIPLALGLGLTSLYYYKWAGTLISPGAAPKHDVQPAEYRYAILSLTAAIIILSASIVYLARGVAKAASESFSMPAELFSLNVLGGIIPLVAIIIVSILAFVAYLMPPKGRLVKGYTGGEEYVYAPSGEYYLSLKNQRTITRVVCIIAAFIFTTMTIAEVF